ncbi:MAG TPA: glycoside hydrolase family 127 protein, partial [Bacillota bacterium]|nr:glycoside hydrolase family 127 protein [Bacillota bacterium]
AECSEDMWTHQYLQMANQIECVPFPGKAIFRTDGCESHLFGLEPNFGCCTANFNQAWPKFALNTFMKSENGIACTLFAPSELRTVIEGNAVSVTLKTDYPFGDMLCYTVSAESPTRFDFSVRIPEWSRGIVSNMPYKAENGFIHFEKQWKGKDTVELEFIRRISLDPRPGDMRTLDYGPLVFALPVKGEWERREYTNGGVERRFPYCDYFIHRKSDWNYAFDSESFEIVPGEIGEHPFSENKPPLTVKAKLRRIEWGFADGYTTVCAPYPMSRIPIGETEEMTLIPYGCTTLRMTEMPLLP